MNIRGLNLNLLPVLDALLTERNVTRAAKKLGMSQPAVSNALAQLRAHLDDPLLVRSGTGMVPTERAVALAEPLAEALHRLETSLGTTPEFDPKSSNDRFVIGTTDYVGFVLLPELVARLRIEAPAVTLRIVAWPLHRVPPTLKTGELDLMIGFFNDVPRAHKSELLLGDKFVLILRKGHPALRRKLTIARYAALDHVLVSQEDQPGVVDIALRKHHLRRNVALRLSHFLMVPPIVAATDLVAAIDRSVAMHFSRTLPLQLVAPPLALPAGRIGQVWHERTDASPAQRWFRKLVSESSRAVEARRNAGR